MSHQAIRLATLFCIATTLLLAESAQAQLRPANTGNFASADSAVTAYSNPAGMTRLDRAEFVSDTILAYSRSQFKVGNQTTTGGGNADTHSNYVAIPSLYFATPALHDRVRLGFSLNVPSGFGSDYGNDWAGRYIATESSLVYFAANATVALKVTDWLSLGTGVQVLYTESTSKARINNLPEGLPDGNVKYEASGIGIGGVFAALLEIDQMIDFEERIGHPMPMRLGLTYRPKTTTNIDGVPEFNGLGPVLAAALAANDLFNKRIDVETTSPQMVGLGFYIEPIERLSISADFMWIDMDQFGSVHVSVDETSATTTSNYVDTYATGISFGWDLTETLEILIGYGYVSPAISNDNRSLSLAIDRIHAVGVGTKYRPRDWFEIFTGFNYYDTGESRVDSQPTTRSGRVKGKSDPHYAIAIDIAMTFRF